uniref:Putative ribonuclease H-like domain-containing protein n=1 Tax=Tanacetum cinerariifolium TaxID=118510 RepID=A0A6L2K375_TANCI|nr:putative ribonuclease H-like domain-containing protein [Tanacetum cinerariifolium]
MNQFCKDKGIKREFSVARTPQQNGIAERRNRTLIEAARTIPPLVDFMKPFGCLVTILNTRDNLGKFEEKANEGYFVGYSVVRSKENLVACQHDKQKELEQEYTLIPICTTDPLISQGTKDSVVKARNKVPEVDESEASDNVGKNDQVPRSKVESLFQQERQTENINSTNCVNTVSLPVNTVGSSFVNAASQTPINVVGPSTRTNAFEEHYFERFSPFKIAFSLLHVPIVSPIDDTGIFGNAYDDEERQMSKAHEDFGLLSSVHKLQRTNHKDFQNFDLSKDKWVIGTKWVYRNKKDERRIVIKNKARLVAQGYTQEGGVDYDEVFAPLARIEAIRLFLAYASFKDFAVYQIDVKIAFLYERIEEEVYVCQPPGFEDPKFPDKVYKVEKALYGLHQAPRAWYETLSTYLLDNGFHRGQNDKTLFIKRHKDDILLVQVYVDDIIFGSTKKELIKQKSDGIFISQDKYVVEVLKKFDFVNVKTTSTPMESNKPLIKDEEVEDVDVHLYRSMIGSLMYLPKSRPDITFAVCACARFQVNPKTSHLHVVKRIFRYLKVNLNWAFGILKIHPLTWKLTLIVIMLEPVLTGNPQQEVVNFLARAKDERCFVDPYEVTTSNLLLNIVGLILIMLGKDETVHKKRRDRMERVATTTSSLEAE